MIFGIGTDLLDARRIERILKDYGERFIKRIALVAEQDYITSRTQSENSQQLKVLHYAKLYAAKEAILKALGTGLAQGIHWHHIEIKRNDQGQPFALLTDQAAQILKTKAEGVPHVHLSLSDEWPYVQAFAMITLGN